MNSDSVAGVANRLLVDSPCVEERTAGTGGGLEEDEDISQYGSVGFIIWYVCLVIFCVLPTLVVVLSCVVLRCRRQDEEDRILANQAEMSAEIARIQANIRAFSNQQEKIRQEQLLHSLASSCVTLQRNHFDAERRLALAGDADGVDIEKQSKDVKTKETNELDFSTQVAHGCSICLNRYVVGDEVIRSATGCGHVFHRDCLVHWFNTRIHEEQLASTVALTQCPCCRQPFVSELVPTPMTLPSNLTQETSTTTTVVASDDGASDSSSGLETAPGAFTARISHEDNAILSSSSSPRDATSDDDKEASSFPSMSDFETL